jgi:hypothetical protein
VTAVEAVRYLGAYYHCDNQTLLSAVRDRLVGGSSEHLQRLVRAVIERCKWMPTVAELREIERSLPAPQLRALPAPPLTTEERRQVHHDLELLLRNLLSGKIVKLKQENAVLKADLEHAAQAAESQALEKREGIAE